MSETEGGKKRKGWDLGVLTQGENTDKTALNGEKKD